VPRSAASRLKGSKVEELLAKNDGGLMRVYGAERRRGLTALSARFATGERPAGAVRGARGEDILALLRGVVEVRREEGMDGGGMLEMEEGLEKVKEGVLRREKEGLIGVLSLHLLRLVGEENWKSAGSTFSLSLSS